jgi:hypothetical protein
MIQAIGIRRWPGGRAMPAKDIFNIDMALGYLAWALCIAKYAWPRLRDMDRVEAHRAIATFNSFRFFGLAFLPRTEKCPGPELVRRLSPESWNSGNRKSEPRPSPSELFFLKERQKNDKIYDAT